MTLDTDTISARQFYGRLVRKLSHRGVLRGLIDVQKLDDDTVDSLGRQLELAAQRWPDRTAVRFEGRSWTWAEFNAWCNRYAHVLGDLGVRDGDVVVVDATNRPAMLAATMAVLKLGGTAALINTSVKGASLTHCIRLVEPAALVVGEEQLDSVRAIHDDLAAMVKTHVFVADAGERPAPDGWYDLDEISIAMADANPARTAEIRLGHDALYIYTSGTTGLPKAAISPHRRLRMGGLVVGRALLELNPDDAVYCALPLYHSTGFLGGWAACVHTGATLVPSRSFRASRFWDDIRECDATAFLYVGEMLRYLCNQPRRSDDRQHRVRAVYGAGLRADLWDAFKQRFGISEVYEVYGASESPSGFLNFFNFDRTCGWNPKGWRAVAYEADAGKPVRGPEGRMRAVGPGEVGLLIMEIDKHQPFTGYTDAAATEKKVLRDAFKPGDAWFDSGDLVLNQGHGHMRFVDRTGDTFRWRGQNVATTEVEGVLNGWRQVEECTVYGVEVPGAEGRCGMAWVKLVDGEDLDLKGFADHLREYLPDYAVPRFLRLGDHVEMTGTLRHKKGDLRDEAFDVERARVPMFLLRPSDDAWQPLKGKLHEAVRSGTERL